MQPAQIHTAFADIVTLSPGTNLDLKGRSVKVLDVGKGADVDIGIAGAGGPMTPLTPVACAARFVPMR